MRSGWAWTRRRRRYCTRRWPSGSPGARPVCPGRRGGRCARTCGSSAGGWCRSCIRRICPCHADPPQPHGPYHQWTRKKDGKTATRILTDDQLADYRPWFDNHKRLREVIAELEELSLAIADDDPRWNR